eukprot:gene14453-biopygen20105
MDPGGGLQCGAAGAKGRFLQKKEHHQVDGKWREKLVIMRWSAGEASGGKLGENGGNSCRPRRRPRSCMIFPWLLRTKIVFHNLGAVPAGACGEKWPWAVPHDCTLKERMRPGRVFSRSRLLTARDSGAENVCWPAPPTASREQG